MIFSFWTKRTTSKQLTLGERDRSLVVESIHTLSLLQTDLVQFLGSREPLSQIDQERLIRLRAVCASTRLTLLPKITSGIGSTPPSPE